MICPTNKNITCQRKRTNKKNPGHYIHQHTQILYIHDLTDGGVGGDYEIVTVTTWREKL
jgi:hypothetical protein